MMRAGKGTLHHAFMEFVGSSELILFASSSLAACRICYLSLFFEAILTARCYDTRKLKSHKTMLKLLKPYVLKDPSVASHHRFLHH